jgi:hypothetical protein
MRRGSRGAASAGGPSAPGVVELGHYQTREGLVLVPPLRFATHSRCAC